jgi:hypothetical protein
MPIGFLTMTGIQAYGDGNGNVVIEEWRTDDFSDESNLIGRVVIDRERFEFIAHNADDLVKEGLSGIAN